jgi:glycosyltransferase involved in cell wall biosynthesis
LGGVILTSIKGQLFISAILSLEEKWPKKKWRCLSSVRGAAQHGGFETFAEKLSLYLVAGGTSPFIVYDHEVLASIREHAVAYCHGHTVGGTNPSLVEALGAGNAVIAHRNKFNLWTAGKDQFFFKNEVECAATFDVLETDPARLARARAAGRRQRALLFTWEKVFAAYESLLLSLVLEHRTLTGANPAIGARWPR